VRRGSPQVPDPARRRSSGDPNVGGNMGRIAASADSAKISSGGRLSSASRCLGRSALCAAEANGAAQPYLRRMATNFTPDEEVEIALLLWEYERDGAMAIDNFIRREPTLSLRMASGVLPVGVQRTIIEYIKKQRR
jgi:hypothetical protein